MLGVRRCLDLHERGCMEKRRSHNQRAERGKGTAEPNTAIRWLQERQRLFSHDYYSLRNLPQLTVRIEHGDLHLPLLRLLWTV